MEDEAILRTSIKHLTSLSPMTKSSWSVTSPTTASSTASKYTLQHPQHLTSSQHNNSMPLPSHQLSPPADDESNTSSIPLTTIPDPTKATATPPPLPPRSEPSRAEEPSQHSKSKSIFRFRSKSKHGTPSRIRLSKSNTSTSSVSLTVTFLLLILFVLSLFPSTFHLLTTLPLSLLSSAVSYPFSRSPSSSSASPNLSSYTTRTPLYGSPAPTMWFQKTITLTSRSRGSYLITEEVLREVPEITGYKVGIANLFIQHTSCALSLNENWDEDVRADMSDALDRLAPEDTTPNESLYRHSAEGKDDMPAHIKSALIGTSLTIPIRDGKLATGTWQGIWYLEFRAQKHQRRVVVTIQGEKM